MYKVMVVDDDSTSLAIARAFLDDTYELMLARSGRQALGALGEGPLPDLILLDMIMPGLSGMDVLNALKQDERLKNIPVIFLTGDQSVDLEVEGYQSGASGFLQKPVNRYLLVVQIQHQIDYINMKHENMMLRSKLGMPVE